MLQRKALQEENGKYVAAMPAAHDNNGRSGELGDRANDQCACAGKIGTAI